MQGERQEIRKTGFANARETILEGISNVLGKPRGVALQYKQVLLCKVTRADLCSAVKGDSPGADIRVFVSRRGSNQSFVRKILQSLVYRGRRLDVFLHTNKFISQATNST